MTMTPLQTKASASALGLNRLGLDLGHAHSGAPGTARGAPPITLRLGRLWGGEGGWAREGHDHRAPRHRHLNLHRPRHRYLNLHLRRPRRGRKPVPRHGRGGGGPAGGSCLWGVGGRDPPLLGLGVVRLSVTTAVVGAVIAARGRGRGVSVVKRQGGVA
jgi:hypothetical protein